MLARHRISVRVRTFASASWLVLVSLLAVGCASYGPAKVGTLSLSASSFNFQKVLVGHSATQTLKVSNTGLYPVQITALSLSSNEFSITGPSVPRVILPANSLTYTLTFTPNGSGSASASVNITSNASVQKESVALAGSGQSAFADLVVTPSSINFGKLLLKTTSTQNVTLHNTGDINLSLQGVTVAGSGFGYSDLSPGFSLAPNQKVTFQVWFTPKVAGPASATVSLLSPNMASPATIGLSGDGVTTTTTPPPASGTQHTVHLTWNASTSQNVGYRVYRSEASNGSYSAMNGTTTSALTYDDSTVASGTTYYYVVTAVDAAGDESVQSNQASAVIPAS